MKTIVIDKQEIFEKIKHIYEDKFYCFDKIDNFYLESFLYDDLDLDSLEQLEFVMAIEDEFDLEETKDKKLEKFKTINSLVEYVYENKN